MSDPFDISEDEKELFRQAMRGVIPLYQTPSSKIKTHQTSTALPKSAIPPLGNNPSVTAALHRLQSAPRAPATYRQQTTFTRYQAIPEAGSQDILCFMRPGLQYKEQRKLKQGRIKIESVLDLHQLTADQTLASCAQFIEHCHRRKLRSVLIIHGKARYHDKPVLKNLLNRWLREQETVLAFHSAQPKHGGTGALYVILKTKSLAFD